MPIIPFLIAATNDLEMTNTYIWATLGISFFFLFVLGFGKSFVTSATWYYSAAETIFIGAISAGAAFGIGSLFGEWHKLEVRDYSIINKIDLLNMHYLNFNFYLF